jgi:hypothetical protein
VRAAWLIRLSAASGSVILRKTRESGFT